MVHDKLFPPQPKGERIHVLGEAAFRGRVQRFGLLPDDRLALRIR